MTDLNNYDPISGFPAYKALLCDVSKLSQSVVKPLVSSGEYALDNRVEKEIARERIYLDNNATTPIDPDVKNAMAEFANCYGNPSSIHAAGRESHEAIEAARKSLSLLINCTPRRLIFNSGGSEGDNFVIKSVAFSCRNTKNHIITTTVEHPAVINTCQWLEKQGFAVTYLPVDRNGIVSTESLSGPLPVRPAWCPL